jgi:NADH-quinone oxidoreductase subunit C
LESLGGAREPRFVTETPDLDQNPIVAKLRAWEPEAIAEALFFRGETTLVVPRERLRRVAEYLASEPDLDFKLLVDITAVDRFPVEPRFELNYHMVSLSRRERLRVRVSVAGRDPVADSVTQVWPTANWHEREIFDLFGVRFAGHPDLRRILMPEEWEGFPLRKDYPVEGPR